MSQVDQGSMLLGASHPMDAELAQFVALIAPGLSTEATNVRNINKTQIAVPFLEHHVPIEALCFGFSGSSVGSSEGSRSRKSTGRREAGSHDIPYYNVAANGGAVVSTPRDA
jgi:hypothetical protein